MLKQVDINCDLGEHYGLKAHRSDLDIIPFISSCNIACGFHSGDPMCIMDTINEAIKYKVAIGAHPSYPDLQGFGRRNMDLSPKELEYVVLYQLSALDGMVKYAGSTLHHVKPHGALYNRAAIDESYAKVILETISRYNPNLYVYCLSESPMAAMAKEKGIRYQSEVFLDRQYEKDLNLRSRQLPNAILDLQQAEQQLHLFTEKSEVKVYSGESIPLEVNSICIHSDTDGSVSMAKHAFDFLKNKDIEITAAI